MFPQVDFSECLRLIKTGQRMKRIGWNGKGMYITYKPGYPDGIPCNKATAVAHGFIEGDIITYGPYLEMYTASGRIVPWLASQSDLLAEDWTQY
jgi:hypothetical protein